MGRLRKSDNWEQVDGVMMSNAAAEAYRSVCQQLDDATKDRAEAERENVRLERENTQLRAKIANDRADRALGECAKVHHSTEYRDGARVSAFTDVDNYDKLKTSSGIRVELRDRDVYVIEPEAPKPHGTVEATFVNAPGNLCVTSKGTRLEIDENHIRVIESASSQAAVIATLEDQIEKLDARIARKDREIERLRKTEEEEDQIAKLRGLLEAASKIEAGNQGQIRSMQSKIDKQTNALAKLERKNANQAEAIKAYREGHCDAHERIRELEAAVGAYELREKILAEKRERAVISTPPIVDPDIFTFDETLRRRGATYPRQSGKSLAKVRLERIHGLIDELATTKAALKGSEEARLATEQKLAKAQIDVEKARLEALRAATRRDPVFPSLPALPPLVRLDSLSLNSWQQRVKELEGELVQAHAEAEEAREEAAKADQRLRDHQDVFPRLGAEVTVTDRPNEKRISILWDGTRITVGPHGLAEVDGEQVVWQAAEKIEMLEDRLADAQARIKGFERVKRIADSVGVTVTMRESWTGPNQMIVEGAKANAIFKADGSLTVVHANGLYSWEI